MVASILILAVSGALLVYWFRYTVVLLLGTRPAKNYAASVAAVNDLRFVEIQGRPIREARTSELPALQKMLERDYHLLTFLLQHTVGLEVAGLTLEQRLLMLDFRLMQILCSLSRFLGAAQARAALEEMSLVLAQLANAIGERIESSSRA